MKKMILLLGVAASQITLAQVGINTEAPKATLDVSAKPSDNTKIDGFIAPRLTGDELKAKDGLYVASQTGTIIYATSAANPTTAKTINVTSSGYYYFDGTLWIKIGTGTGIEPWNLENTTTQATLNTQNIYQNGNLGIGNFAAAKPISKLDVRGAIRGGIPHADEISGVSAIGLNSIAVGQNNIASGNNTAVIGGSGNTNSATSAVILGSTNTAIASTAGNAAILSSNTSQINGTSPQAVIFGGANNTIANSPYSIILSGSQNLIDATTGRSIVLSGTRNTITGGANGSVAGGSDSVSSGFSSFAFGQKATASGYASLAFGNETKSTAISSFATGYQSTASGNYSFVTGRGTTASTYVETVIGQNNEITTGDAANWQYADPTFQIGIGPSPSTPKNAVTVYKNGKVQLNQLKGAGNAYACIDTNGNLFRSSVPCPVAVAP